MCRSEVGTVALITDPHTRSDPIRDLTNILLNLYRVDRGSHINTGFVSGPCTLSAASRFS